MRLNLRIQKGLVVERLEPQLPPENPFHSLNLVNAFRKALFLDRDGTLIRDVI